LSAWQRRSVTYLLQQTKRLEGMEYVESSGNVFADLGISEPEEAMAKVAMKIYETIKAKKLTQAKAAKVLKISQPKVFLLLWGLFNRFFFRETFAFFE
jgi:predicted XRE-type DNA-binding protein